MKSFVFALLLCVPAFAAKPAYVAECRVAAVHKLQAQAQAKRASLVVSSVKVTAIDDRIWSPWKYVWFAGSALQRDGKRIRLQTMTQKSFLPPLPCF